MVEYTYILEGDGPTALLAYDFIEDSRHFLDHHHDDPATIPGLGPCMLECETAIVNATHLADAQPVHGAIKELAQRMVGDALSYFTKVIYGGADDENAELRDDIQLYSLARMFNVPAMKSAGQLRAFADIRPLIVSTKRFSEAQIEAMAAEWREYGLLLTHYNDAERGEKETPAHHAMRHSTVFWERHRHDMPALTDLAYFCFLLAASSGSAERVFSILKRSTDKVRMSHSLEDLTETQVMTIFNDPLTADKKAAKLKEVK